MKNQNKNLSEKDLIEKMKSFEQTKGQTIYQHGLSVWEQAKKICSGQYEGMKIPDWFKENHFIIVNQTVPYKTLKRYCIFHDCGKPFCQEIDEQGNIRFPDHADISAEKYAIAFPQDRDGYLLTKHDMALHTWSSKEIEGLCRGLGKNLCFSLIISAFAELHSNANMFGGIESTSFKIKWKKVNQRSRQIFKYFESAKQGEKYYSYMVLRNDMDVSHKYVQASHAAMEHKKHSGYEHPSIICVVVKNQNKLKSVANKLIEQGIEFKSFTEGAGVHKGEMTTISTDPIRYDHPDRNFFKRYQLA